MQCSGRNALLVAPVYNACNPVSCLDRSGSAWTENGRMKIERRDHAIVEANLTAICAEMGKSVEKEQVYVKL